MPKKLIRHHAVEEDLLRIATYVASDNVVAAQRLLDAVELTFNWICQFPLARKGIRTPDTQLVEVRMTPVQGFRNYLVFYVIGENDVKILYVFHGARSIPDLLEQDQRI
ncbi:type II toxin-antitoxin system RelE/ParE family toxin [Verrucomicrobia bacterium]|jgi:toxin ParE1/3/4|nr:type II toxin-antitoxin system RelE/ParE family toxin [Verrucomicrobiota bacterium]